MSNDLPSLHGFLPDFYVGGPERYHLPLAYDLVAALQPRVVVVLGLGDGELYFALCQAARERHLASRVTVVRVQEDGPAEADDTWQAARAYAAEFYGDAAVFLDSAAEAAAMEFTNGGIELLVVNDCESEERLSAWQPKLSPSAVVCVHGIGLARDGAIPQLWREWKRDPALEFPLGIGMGVLLNEARDDMAALRPLYELVAARIDAEIRAARLEQKSRALELRQIWIPSLLDDRVSMQEMIDHLNRHIGHITRVSEWDAGQAAEAKRLLEAQLATAEAALKNQKQSPPHDLKKPLPFKQKLAREARRIAAQVGFASPPESKPAFVTTPVAAIEPREPTRYDHWIAEHEPTADELQKQRNAAAISEDGRVRISLLVPVHNPSATFLEEMIASVIAQTYPHWELCLVDAASNAETADILKACAGREPRVKLRRLERNLGIAENTNRALALATGEFVALLDHDDLLAPFALFEVARAIRQTPDADMLYSDEDRWSESGQRHSPFFKPEWSPELLYACMYLGHLTVYRRSFIDELGGLRSEFDLSQDYDLALRATERARRIIHLPHVLYHWREHPGSGSLGGKPDARKTNLAALADAMQRRKLDANVIEYPSANRARMKLKQPRRASIIVPTDSHERAMTCAVDLPRETEHANYELIIVTNSALVREIDRRADRAEQVRTVSYDQPFNFSNKCNKGADLATGDTLIFLNDDVVPQQRDWIENLIEPLENPEVGAAAPKMVYANGTIQHAGLVTAVRNLVGTAFHLLPADSTEHVNFAQSMRTVSALSGACLVTRRAQFEALGGFDAVQLPIFHSDVDFCFKLRDAGLRCVYTPFVVMRHAGHVSLAEHEKSAPPAKDKSDVYLLKRWAGYSAHDPYFPTNMRDWLYRDSPAPIQIYGRNDPKPRESKRDLLIVAAHLDAGGQDTCRLAIDTEAAGDFVVVISARDGELREAIIAANIPVIVDPLVFGNDGSFAKFCRNFDAVIITSPQGEPAAATARMQHVPVEYWP